MRLLTLYLRHSKVSLIAAVALGMVSGLSAALLLAVINYVLSAGAWDRMVFGVFTGLCFVRLLSGLGAHVLLIRLSQRAIFDMRMDLCERILRSPLRHLEKLGAHRLMACFSDDVMNVSNVVVNVPYFFVNIVVLIGCLTYLGWMSLPVLLGMLTCIALGILTYLVPVLWATRHLKAARTHQDSLFGRYEAVVRGIKEFKLHHSRQKAFWSDALHPSAEAVRYHSVFGIVIYAAAANWNRLLFFIYVGILIFILPGGVVTPPAVLAGYVLVILYLMAPLEAIMNSLPHLAKADVSLRKVHELGLSLETPDLEPTDFSTSSIPEWRDLELRGVYHRYDSERDDEQAFVLGPIDLTFRPGEVAYITGGNGSGKTTLMKLLAGLYVPDDGRLQLNGTTITESMLPEYRQLFSAVFSEFHLFDELHGLDGNNLDERARDYLHRLGLDHKLFVQNGRLSTIQLSHGQRKRLALLSALLEDRPIYALDEWAADQEPAFRDMFYHKIVPDLQRRGKTVIVITHDDRYFHLADRLIKLDCGRVVEDNVQKPPAIDTPQVVSSID